MEKATMLQLRTILTDAKVKTEEGLSRSDLIDLITKKDLTGKVLELIKKKGGKSIQPDVLESQSESEAEKPNKKVPRKVDKSEGSESKDDVSESKSEAEKLTKKASKSVDKSEGSESKSESKKAPGPKRGIKVTSKTNADSEADEDEKEIKVKTPAKAKVVAKGKLPAKTKAPAKVQVKASTKAKLPVKAKTETDSLSGSSEEHVKPVRRAANVKPKATRAAAKTSKVVANRKAVHVVIDNDKKFIAAYAGLAKLKAALASHYPDSKYDDFLTEDGYEGVKVIDFIDWE